VLTIHDSPFASGSILDFVALGFASQALVAALGGAVSLLMNVLVAHCYNQEVPNPKPTSNPPPTPPKLTLRPRQAVFYSDCMGVGCILIGALIFAVTASEATGTTLAQLEYNFSRPGFVVYLTLQVPPLCNYGMDNSQTALRNVDLFSNYLVVYLLTLRPIK